MSCVCHKCSRISGLSKITFCEGPAGYERISCVCFRATADRGQTSKIAIGTNSARPFTRVLADTINTGWASAGTVAVAKALWTTFGVGTANISGWTLAHSSVVSTHFAIGTFSTLVASVDAFESGAVLLVAAFTVMFAFVATSVDGITLGTKIAIIVIVLIKLGNHQAHASLLNRIYSACWPSHAADLINLFIGGSIIACVCCQAIAHVNMLFNK